MLTMGYVKKLKHDAAADLKKDVLSPISTLPSEILVKIFTLAVESRPCPLRSDDDDKFIPAVSKHPDSLLFVCFRWHAIAISSRSLWSHIDVVLSCPESEMFLARAKAFVARAEGAPLDIHIVDPGTHPRYRIPPILKNSNDHSYEEEDGDNIGGENDDVDSENEDIVDSEDEEDDSMIYMVSSENEAPSDNHGPEIKDLDCFGPISELTPIRSLELATYCEYHMSQLVALQYYLSRCAPGTLTQLLIRTEDPADDPLGHFIEYGYVGGSLDVQAEDTEKPLASVATLHLKGLYPYWTSQAYHCLADLYLGGRVRIPEQQLVNILKSSPNLQALRLNCRITDPTARQDQYGEYEDEPPFDVHLKDLEILDIHSLSYYGKTTLLRRLSYSPRPLRLCLTRVDRDDAISHLLIRSENLNVTELRVTEGKLGDLYEYLERYPKLHILVIGEWDQSELPYSDAVSFLPKSDLYWYEPGDKDRDIRLDTLYVIRLAIPYNELQAMVGYYSVRRLVIWNSLITGPGGKVGPTDAEIAVLCPVVNNLGRNAPNPVEK